MGDTAKGSWTSRDLLGFIRQTAASELGTRPPAQVHVTVSVPELETIVAALKLFRGCSMSGVTGLSVSAISKLIERLD